MRLAVTCFLLLLIVVPGCNQGASKTLTIITDLDGPKPISAKIVKLKTLNARGTMDPPDYIYHLMYDVAVGETVTPHIHVLNPDDIGMLRNGAKLKIEDKRGRGYVLPYSFDESAK